MTSIWQEIVAGGIVLAALVYLAAAALADAGTQASRRLRSVVRPMLGGLGREPAVGVARRAPKADSTQVNRSVPSLRLPVCGRAVHSPSDCRRP